MINCYDAPRENGENARKSSFSASETSEKRTSDDGEKKAGKREEIKVRCDDYVFLSFFPFSPSRDGKLITQFLAERAFDRAIIPIRRAPARNVLRSAKIGTLNAHTKERNHLESYNRKMIRIAFFTLIRKVFLGGWPRTRSIFHHFIHFQLTHK